MLTKVKGIPVTGFPVALSQLHQGTDPRNAEGVGEGWGESCINES